MGWSAIPTCKIIAYSAIINMNVTIIHLYLSLLQILLSQQTVSLSIPFKTSNVMTLGFGLNC